MLPKPKRVEFSFNDAQSTLECTQPTQSLLSQVRSAKPSIVTSSSSALPQYQRQFTDRSSSSSGSDSDFVSMNEGDENGASTIQPKLLPRPPRVAGLRLIGSTDRKKSTHNSQSDDVVAPSSAPASQQQHCRQKSSFLVVSSPLQSQQSNESNTSKRGRAQPRDEEEGKNRREESAEHKRNPAGDKTQISSQSPQSLSQSPHSQQSSTVFSQTQFENIAASQSREQQQQQQQEPAAARETRSRGGGGEKNYSKTVAPKVLGMYLRMSEWGVEAGATRRFAAAVMTHSKQVFDAALERILTDGV